MKKNLFLVFAALSALALSACGGDDLDQQAASQAMAEAMSAGSTAYSKVGAEMGKLDGNWVTGTASSFTISGTVTNPTGSGAASVTGTGSKAGTGFKMDLKMAFADWKSAQGLVLNGTLNMSYDVTSMTTFNYTMKYSGDLEVSGTASGTASFDLTITYGGIGQVKVCGTVGGVDVSYGGSC